MNTKSWTIAGVIVIILAFSHYMSYRYGRESMRAEILSQPIVSDTTHGPLIPWKPPVHGEADANWPDNGPVATQSEPEITRHPGTIPGLLGVIDSLKTLVGMKNLSLSSALRVMRATIKEYGNKVDVTADPATRRFAWDWIPAQAESSALTTITNTRFVPAPEKDFWIVGHLALNGGGGTVGFKSIGIGRLMTAGTKPITFLSAKIEF